MLSALTLAGVLTASPGDLGFRLKLQGTPGSVVVVTARAPRGWLPTFCSTRVCSIGHVRVTLSKTGFATVDLSMHAVTHVSHGTGTVTADGKRVLVRL